MKKTGKFKKAQTAEILNFLVLVVAVTIIILVLKFVVVDQMGDTGGTAQEAQEEGSFRSGANAFMVMTEEKSGKTFLELLGYVGYTENTTVDLGGPKKPLVINVTEEVAKRLDKIYGEGHWYLELPIPHRSGVEIVVVADTSLSMCDDILDLKTGIQDILTELKKAEKETYIYLYFLGNVPTCYWMDNETDIVHKVTVDCSEFKDTGIECIDISIAGNKECRKSYPLQGQGEEDWGNGIACISEIGPQHKNGEVGWGDFTVRIAIPLSDELTCSTYNPGGGCNCYNAKYDGTGSNCATQRKSLNNGIESAKKNNVMIFPLRADPCGIQCTSLSESSCYSYNRKSSYPRKCPNSVPCDYCDCGNTTLKEWMGHMASETGGQMFDLAIGSPAKAIKEMVLNQSFERKPVVLGSPIPGGTRIRSFIVAAPMPNYEYLNLTLKQWN